MEHVSSVRPTGKFPEKVENLKRWSRFPGWKFLTECRVPFTFLVDLYQFQVHGRAPPRTGVYDQMEQLFTNRKFHFCYHRNFRVFFVNGKRPSYTFFSSIENFSAYCPVLRGSILLPPRHPIVFARMARWQLHIPI